MIVISTLINVIMLILYKHADKCQEGKTIWKKLVI